jgi:hypothetical protein
MRGTYSELFANAFRIEKVDIHAVVVVLSGNVGYANQSASSLFPSLASHRCTVID